MGEAVRETFLSVTGETLQKRLWLPQGEPQAVVQLIHGMAEHIDRYDPTAHALNAAGLAVAGHNHLGHGQGAQVLGHFAQKGGWEALIEDTHALRRATQEAYPGIPYFLLGHSMGSFVARGYALKHEKGLAGLILSGTGHFDPPILAVAGLIARVQCALGGGKKPSAILASMSSAGYNKSYGQARTTFDWLSSDHTVVDAYIADPFCGFTFTARAYRDLFHGLTQLYPQKLSAMEKDVPVLLFSGQEDPVGAYGKGVEKVAREIRGAGVKDVTVRLYENARHEMFNEQARKQVWADVIAWIEERIPKQE